MPSIRRFLGLAVIPAASALSSEVLSALRDPLPISYGASPVTESLLSSAANPDLLQCYEVAPPVLGPSGPLYYPVGPTVPDSPSTSESLCQTVLMQHDFAYSYGSPFVGTYNPPSCDFDRVILNLTVTSAGVQFDRLAVMYLGDIEVWRTSTAEPTTNGIIWTYWKDLTPYLSLWKKQQKIIFDLGNIVDNTYTGIFHTTLTATFFKAETSTSVSCTSPPADLIVPISAARSATNQTSAWNVPNDVASRNATLPKNIRRAVFSISGNGQSNEEFWWSNVLESDIDTFAPTVGRLPGYSPWREVQLLIDGELAGVDWPFPVIFTGGVSPTFHRPMAGLQAFDLLEQEIDITAWLPKLCDGNEHQFEIKVTGFTNSLNHDITLVSPVDSYWVLTGTIFVWLDDADAQTTGEMKKIYTSIPTPSISYTSMRLMNGTDGYNQSLSYSVEAERTFSVISNVTTSAGTEHIEWHQVMKYTNKGFITNFGNDQTNDMLIVGADASSRGLISSPGSFAGANATQPTVVNITYNYPLNVFLHYDSAADGSYEIDSTMYQGFNRTTNGHPVFSTGIEAFGSCSAYQDVPVVLSTYRNGTASLSRDAAGSGSGSGSMFQNLQLGAGGIGSSFTSLFDRNVTATNGSTVNDQVRVFGEQRRDLERMQVDQKPLF